MEAQQNPGQQPEQLYVQPEGGQASDPAKVAAIAEQLERERLTGIGGWLIVFAVLTILSLLAQLFNLFSSGTGIRELDGLVTPRALISLVLGGIVLALFFSKKAVFPKVVKIYLILEVVLSIIFSIMTYNALSSYFGGMGGAVGGGMFVGVLISVAFSIAWIAYFSKSKRVQYTFVE